MIWALGIQGLILIGAVYVGILRQVPEEEPRFVAVSEGMGDNLQQQRQQTLQEIQRWSSGAQNFERIVADTLLADMVPAVELQPMGDFQSEVMSDWNPMGFAQFAVTSGAFDLSGGASVSSSVTFLGLETEATRLVIAIDISTTVKRKVEQAGLSMDVIRNEAWQNIEKMDGNTMFGLIQFARNYDRFQPHLLPATRRHRDRAEVWLNNHFRIDGRAASGWQREHPNGIESVIAAAFAMDPNLDTLIIVSDGDFYLTPSRGGSQKVSWQSLIETTRRLQSGHSTTCAIHLVGFQVKPEDRLQIIEWLRPYGGRLIEIKGAQDSR